MSVQQFFEQIGKIDHLHITAAELSFGDIDALSMQEAKDNMDSKFWGTYRVVKYGHPYVAQDGSITLYSGAASQKPNGDAPLVTAITSAIEGLSKALAISLSPIRINTISPGITLTPLIQNYGDEVVEQILIAHKEHLLIRRYGKPEEIAQAAIYLMSNEYVTGTVQMINGGLGV